MNLVSFIAGRRIRCSTRNTKQLEVTIGRLSLRAIADYYHPKEQTQIITESSGRQLRDGRTRRSAEATSAQKNKKSAVYCAAGHKASGFSYLAF
jgi:hypothetical protein